MSSNSITISSYHDLDYTYSYDKYSCVRSFYFYHIVCAYLVGLSGLACFITRLVPSLKWTHAWFGRLYIISMLWCTATSLLINNTGLPLAVLINFAWVLSGMCIAWILILFHGQKLNRLALASLSQKLMTSQTKPEDLSKAILEEKTSIVKAKTWKQRIFSYKAAHGILMWVSWINISGRLFASNQSGDFTCHTYPAYKPGYQEAEELAFANNCSINLVPEHNPYFDRLPWAFSPVGWGISLLFGPLIGGIIFGAIYSCIEAPKKAHPEQKKGGRKEQTFSK